MKYIRSHNSAHQNVKNLLHRKVGGIGNHYTIALRVEVLHRYELRMMNGIEEKFKVLQDRIREMNSVLVAFSGGVDSTFLLKVAHEVLGGKVLAVTGNSNTFPDHEIQCAKKLAHEIGVDHVIVSTNEMNIPGFYENTSRRCYYCKRELFGLCLKKALDLKFEWVVDGANYDDKGDFRPGMEAAMEMGIRSPLLESELTKDDIRKLSRKLNLSTWNKPSYACLSSRIPYGTEIREELLSRVDSCENAMRELGFEEYRVRYHDEIARIEVGPSEMSRLWDEEIRRTITRRFKEFGFTYVTLDLEGYRTGSMNEVLNNHDK